MVARPTARVLALLEILQAGGAHTVADLAARLDVDERTVRRYVTQLIELDVPVHTIRGRYGGYRLAPGYRMPPLMFTDEEALAVLFGLIAGRRAGLVTSSGTAAESAAAKLRRVLPQASGRRLHALLEATDVTAPEHPAVAADAEVLLLLAEAARDRRPVAMSYSSREGRYTARTLAPYGIVAHSGRWYVAGHDSASGQVRTFRLDRISLPRTLPGHFEVPDGFDPSTTVVDTLAGTPWRHEVSVRVQASVADLRARLPAGLTTLSVIDADWVRVRLRAERLDWVPALLAGLDLPFVIEAPDQLRPLVRSLAARLNRCATAECTASVSARSSQSQPTSPCG